MTMSRSVLSVGFVLCATASLASPGAARDVPTPDWFREIEVGAPDVLVNDVDGGVRPMRRCATPSLPADRQQAVEEALALWRQLVPGAEARPRVIPVAFHIVHKGQGNITDDDVFAQIDELNRGYRKFGATFEVVRIDRKRKGAWYKKCQRQGPFNKMTRKLAVDPAHTLNIYTCRPGENLLGFAIPPSVLPEDHPWNAVVLHWGTLPGGPLFPYDEGATAVHEVGHYFGLAHTFQNGCSAPGDEVNDTPYEASPAFGCQIGRDTCPQAGKDPVRNYMDYSDDACLETFSKGQRKRMDEMLDLFRPGLSN